MIIEHKKLRRVLEWAYPGRLVELKKAWDGVENKQAYLDREARWSGLPVAATEIEAKEADYDAHITILNAPPSDDELIARSTIFTDRVLIGLVKALNNGAIVPGANVSNAALKAAIKANMR